MGKTCPCCNETALRRAIRRGVEIDYCPECNGIWLDNGELTKIVAESVQVSETENSPAEIAAQKSRKSIFRSFLNVMGTTTDNAEDIFGDDSSYGPDSESDFEDD
jgi:Zn-finger nucleic acid-binding protein